MAKRVENFVYEILVNVFNAKDTASIVNDSILELGTYDPGPKAKQIEDPNEWTPELILKNAASLSSDKGPEGNFDD
ncbi:MAG: hypothetical protein JRJ39_11335 [Deltaproteobacteria bacterium]|nr:hypothetical protein [Deltaproteobacteria bacterium]